MKLHDLNNRLAALVPHADDIDDFTLEGAKEESRNCEKCNGEGFASVFSPYYQGRDVEIATNWGNKQVLMRTNAYCICPAGRKIAVIHQQTAKDIFLRTPDYHDVVAGNCRGWQANDPTFDPDEAIDLLRLPESMRAMAAKLKPPRIFYPGNGAF